MQRRHAEPSDAVGNVERHHDRLVFTDDDGRGIRRTAFSREIWRPAIATAGVPRGTGFHYLRHYHASLLIRHSESIKTVQRRLGHATATLPVSRPRPVHGPTL